MAKRSTIGLSPLDAIIPVTPAELKVADEAVAYVESERSRPIRQTKERLTVHLSVPLIERVKNAVYWTPGLTLAGLAEKALAQAIRELEQQNGGAFMPRREELKGGRPLK